MSNDEIFRVKYWKNSSIFSAERRKDFFFLLSPFSSAESLFSTHCCCWWFCVRGEKNWNFLFVLLEWMDFVWLNSMCLFFFFFGCIHRTFLKRVFRQLDFFSLFEGMRNCRHLIGNVSSLLDYSWLPLCDCRERVERKRKSMGKKENGKQQLHTARRPRREVLSEGEANFILSLCCVIMKWSRKVRLVNRVSLRRPQGKVKSWR